MKESKNNKSKSFKGCPMYGSSAHRILLISKFYGHEIDFSYLKEMNPKVFKYPSDFNREMLRLKVNGYIIPSSSDKKKWQISNKGIVFLYDLAKRKARIHGAED